MQDRNGMVDVQQLQSWQEVAQNGKIVEPVIGEIDGCVVQNAG